MVSENWGSSSYSIDEFPSGISQISFKVNSDSYRIKGGVIGIALNDEGYIEAKTGWVVEAEQLK